MSTFYEQAVERIEAQQPKERGPVWMVGEQLKDMIREDPAAAELVFHDLSSEELSISACEKKIKEFADKHKKNGFSCVIPSEADRIIREFYGLYEPREQAAAIRSKGAPATVVRLEDFF